MSQLAEDIYDALYEISYYQSWPPRERIVEEIDKVLQRHSAPSVPKPPPQCIKLTGIDSTEKFGKV
jgi:hypothetical protein